MSTDQLLDGTVAAANPDLIGSGIMVFDRGAPLELVEQLYLFCLDAMDYIGEPGMTVGGLMADYKVTTDIRLSAMETWKGEWSVERLREVDYDMPDLDMQMVGVVTEILRAYTTVYTTIAEMNFADSGYQMQRYKKGEGFYKQHVDGDPKKCSERILALVIYLNDVAEGGETYFPWQGVKVQPRRGRVVVFPANWLYPHEALVPVSDDKYMISTFITLGQ